MVQLNKDKTNRVWAICTNELGSDCHIYPGESTREKKLSTAPIFCSFVQHPMGGMRPVFWSIRNRALPRLSSGAIRSDAHIHFDQLTTSKHTDA